MPQVTAGTVMGRRFAYVVLATLVAGSVIAPAAPPSTFAAQARATGGPATDALRPSVDQVLRILTDDTLKGPAHAQERRRALRQVMVGAIDFREAARRALALHWQDRTDTERAEFVELFREVVISSYATTLDTYGGQTVVYTGETASDGATTVLTRVQGRQGAPMPVDYRMHQQDGRWLIYDVVIEGVSLVANYRAQFNTIVRSSSYAELLRRLRARVTELTAPAANRPVTRS